MPQTEYTYKLKLRGDQAVGAAREFKTALQAELSNVKVQMQVDMTSARTQAQRVAAVTSRASMQQWDRDLQQYQGRLQRLAPETFGGPMSAMFKAQQAEYQRLQGALPFEDAMKLADPATKATKEFKALTDQVERAQAATMKMGVSVDEWQKMSTQGGQFGGMASWAQRWGTGIQAAQRRWWGVRGMGYQAQALGRGAMMAGAAGLGGGALATREYLKYAEPMNRAARNLELNAEMTEYLDQALRELAGTASAFDPRTQAEGLYIWAAATGEIVDSQQELDAVLQRTAQVQKLSKLGMVEMGTAVEAVTDIQSQYQMSIESTQMVVDTMIKVAAVSKAEVTDLAEAFKYVGGRANMANTSFVETSAALQIMSQWGIRASMAGRGLARLFENLIAPSSAARTEMDALFTDVFGRTDVLVTAEGQFVGLSKAIDILAEATENLTDVERSEFIARITTQNAARALIPLVETQIAAREREIDAMQGYANIIKGVAGEHEQALQQMMRENYGFEISLKSATETGIDQMTQYMESASGAADMIKASWAGAVTTIGAVVAKEALPMVQGLVGGLHEISGWAEAHPWAVEAIMQGAGLLIVVGGLAQALGMGVRLYADAMVIKTAGDMLDAADNEVGAALIQLEASANQLQAAGLQVSASTAAKVAAGPGAAVAGGGAAGWLMGALRAAFPVLLAMIAGDISIRLLTGKGTYDLMTTGAERRQGIGEAETMAPMLGRQGIAVRIDQLTKEQEELQRWLTASRIHPRRYGEPESRWTGTREELEKAKAEIPPSLRVLGTASAELIANELAIVMGALERYIQLLHKYDAILDESADSATDWISKHGPAAEAQYLEGLPGRVMGIYPNLERYYGLADAMKVYGDSLGYAAKQARTFHDEMSRQEDVLDRIAEAFGGDVERAGIYGRPVGIGVRVARYDPIQAALRMVGDFKPTQEELAILAGRTAEQAKGRITSMAVETDWPGMEKWAARTYGEFQGGLLEALSLDKIEDLSQQQVEVMVQAYIEGFFDIRQAGIDMLNALTEHSASAWSTVLGYTDVLTEQQALKFADDWDAAYSETESLYKDSDDRVLEYHLMVLDEGQQAELQTIRETITEGGRLRKAAMKDAQREWENLQKGFRGMVKAALAPTEVTPEDVWATGAGMYKDKWDEPMRQIRSAIYDPTSDFRGMVPAEVFEMDAAGQKEWLEQFEVEYYAGMKPELINWPAFLDELQRDIDLKAGEEGLIDLAMQKAAEGGIDISREDVQAALGFRSPFIDAYFGGATPSQAGQQLSTSIDSAMEQIRFDKDALEGPSTQFATVFFAGIKTELADMDLTAAIAGIFSTDLSENQGAGTPAYDFGTSFAHEIFNGMLDEMETLELIDKIVNIVLRVLRGTT